MSNIVDHARYELELLGEDEDTIKGYLGVIEAFAAMGHSGGSAAIAIPVINKLLLWKNLKPLTDNPEEWDHIDKEIAGTDHLWQSKRDPEAFSNNGGNTFWLLHEQEEGMITDYPRQFHVSDKHA